MAKLHHGGMTLSEAAIAGAAHHAAEQRLVDYASAPGVDVRRGVGWFAVRTGVYSNDMNGVVSDTRTHIEVDVIRDLVAWFGSVPASWLMHRPDVELATSLLKIGARPERTGVWSGREMPMLQDLAAPCEVVPVRSPFEFDSWLDVAAECGWVHGQADRRARQALQTAMASCEALDHWLALDDGEAVGFATSYIDGQVLDLCNLGVVERARRRGIGRALVTARLRAAALRGVAVVVSAPSEDGWRLQQALGFQTASVVADTWFYLPEVEKKGTLKHS